MRETAALENSMRSWSCSSISSLLLLAKVARKESAGSFSTRPPAFQGADGATGGRTTSEETRESGSVLSPKEGTFPLPAPLHPKRLTSPLCSLLS